MLRTTAQGQLYLILPSFPFQLQFYISAVYLFSLRNVVPYNYIYIISALQSQNVHSNVVIYHFMTSR